MLRFVRWAAALSATLCALGAQAQTSSEEAKARIESALQSVVKISAKATPNARSNATLGEERSGNGVLIENDLVLTIGYLIMEADEIEIIDSKGKRLPAKVAGYDHASGFGLVRLIAPTSSTPIALGSSGALALREPVLSVPFGGIANAQPAFVIAKRLFSGAWEYKLDEALYIYPPIMDWSGSGLFTKDGALVGIGSLFLRNANGDGQPGNMFVPIDLLKPILSDLKSDGRSKSPARPWLGVSTEDRQRGLMVVRVSPEGPGDEAGLAPGDLIVSVNGAPVSTQSAFYDALWSRGSAGVTVNISVERNGETQRLRVKSIDRMDFLKPRTTL
jgi:serine protease Do